MTLTTESALRKDKRNAVSTMEHRHFATVAAILRDMDIAGGQRSSVIRQFADALARTNLRFDRERFLRACGET